MPARSAQVSRITASVTLGVSYASHCAIRNHEPRFNCGVEQDSASLTSRVVRREGRSLHLERTEEPLGIDLNSMRLLFYSRDRGVSFERTATIGRQGVYMKPADVRAILGENGVGASDPRARKLITRETNFAEPLFEVLGASSVESFDASDYEGATHCIDMNKPLPEQFRNRYTAVVDAGTLEHVFNFPVAIANCMAMTEVGGHFICASPMNNFGGHGFYQFSLELYFRVFSAENGFEMEKMFACEGNRGATWYEVLDPKEVGGRMDFVNSIPTIFMMIARKVRDVTPFAEAPQQSDYVAIWTPGDSQRSQKKGIVYSAYSSLPPSLRAAARNARDRYRALQRKLSPFDPRFVRKADLQADRRDRR